MRIIQNMETWEYKGFSGSIEFSEEDNVYFGKILGIRGLVTYEGDPIEELKEAFYESVDYYLDLCKIRDINPYA